ncbi:MAG TPA: PQQ-binding-like beta-propeller repeat protein [Gemmataceae bacterium]|nr:PQQ-binding-like beta-propeller repeat protein [Gemmataceae bacterium]
MMYRWKWLACGLFLLTASLPVLSQPRAPVAVPEFTGAPARTDSPMFGGTPQRNMVNTVDKNIPIDWSVEEGKLKNIKWIATMGTKCYGGPVIAEGKIFVGTNNKNPRDKKVTGDLAVLMCFNEADGKFLWQITHDIPADGIFNEARPIGLCSTPIVETGKIYYTTPGAEVICADTNGKVLWRYDMMKELKVVPFHLANCSPVIVGELLMIVTSNGVDEEGKVHSPKAPSFIALKKDKGTLAWQSNLPGDKIIEGQWSNPAVAVVNGKQQVIFPGGDAFIYGLDPENGKMIWKCDCNPQRKKKVDSGEINPYIISTPVIVGDRLYVGLGIFPDHGASLPFSQFLCLDVTKKGDASPKTLNAKDPANKDSALVWSMGGELNPVPKKGRRVYFGKTISTASVSDGLVYITEEVGFLHCIDAKTGQRYWEHDFRENVWGSPYCVDGKVYVGTVSGDIFVFAQGKECKYYAEGKLHTPKKSQDVKAVANMEDNVESTPVVANGVLYIATRSKLYAIANGK